MKFALLSITVLMCIGVACSGDGVVEPRGDTEIAAWGWYERLSGGGEGEFYNPAGLAIGPDGALYVADYNNDRVQVFDRVGRPIRQWRLPGIGWPIATDAEGNVYVANTTTDRIFKFDSEGRALLSWGGAGSDPGQFKHPQSIAVDSRAGRVYVGDGNRRDVQVFTTDGEYLDVWPMTYAQGIAVDEHGFVYLTDSSCDCVHKVTGLGDEVLSWGEYGSDPGEFTQPRGIAVGPGGDVYVAEPTLHRVQKFTSRGDYLASWGSYGAGAGEMSTPTHVAVANDGSVYVNDLYDNHRVNKFDADGNYLSMIGKPSVPAGAFAWPRFVATDGRGLVYVTDGPNHRVQAFLPNGVFVLEWGGLGSGDGRFDYPEGIAVHGDNVYVVDRNNNRVQRFDRRGRFVSAWGGGWGSLLFRQPIGITTDRSGNVYVAEDWRVQKLTPDGVRLARYWIEGTLIDVAVDDDGNIYVTTQWLHAVRKFDAEGSLVKQWGSRGSAPGEFEHPFGIAVGPDGHVYVADADNYRVQEFDPDGEFVAEWGTEGSLSRTQGVTCAGEFVFVADSNNYRILRVPVDRWK